MKLHPQPETFFLLSASRCPSTSMLLLLFGSFQMEKLMVGCYLYMERTHTTALSAILFHSIPKLNQWKNQKNHWNCFRISSSKVAFRALHTCMPSWLSKQRGKTCQKRSNGHENARLEHGKSLKPSGASVLGGKTRELELQSVVWPQSAPNQPENQQSCRLICEVSFEVEAGWKKSFPFNYRWVRCRAQSFKPTCQAKCKLMKK